jgi:hypothetical protein
VKGAGPKHRVSHDSEGRTFDSRRTCHFHAVLARVITERYRSATRKLA